MSRFAAWALQLALLAVLAACSPVNAAPGNQTPAPAAEPTATVVPAGVTLTPGPGPIGPQTLRIWVPPRFSPAPDAPAGALLKARLDEFVLLHPGVRVTVRIKAETGSGGMVRSLEAMNAAVPEALPDLVLFSRPEMERAARSGLLAVFPGLDAGWYEFAQSLSSIDGQVIGLPFAADALVLLYRLDSEGPPPADWVKTLQLDSPLLFAAGDSRGLFTLAQYLSAGGTFTSESGQPDINPFDMAEVFQFYRQGNQAGVFPGWMAGLTSQAEVYQSLQAGSARAGIVWASDVIQERDPDFRTADIPGPGGVPAPIATGWLWALGNPDSPHQQLSMELARFLTEADFMGEWTLAAGLLPPRPDALAAWPVESETAFAGRLLAEAYPLPPLAILETNGPLIRDALAVLWAGESTLMEAAESVRP